ncbi:MAG: hypothetical protein Q4C65_14255 [Eubacteriales bacterium]|nr:hypothetical protein [Eubacteriales bacterium]
MEQWRAWIINPDSYLPSLTLADGSRIRSVLPTQNESRQGAAIAVLGELRAAEQSFEKQSEDDQIVITFRDGSCGEAMQEALNLFAAQAGGTVKTVYEIEANERTKTDYKLVRDITVVAEGVEYHIKPQAQIAEKLNQGSTLQILQYLPEEKRFIWTEASWLQNGLISLHTKYPTGIFAVVLG